MQEPTIGRIVIYHTTEEERELMRATSYVNVQSELPAVIVSVWSGECVNAKVLIDGGIGDLWKTSISMGDNEGQWSWPEIKS